MDIKSLLKIGGGKCKKRNQKLQDETKKINENIIKYKEDRKNMSDESQIIPESLTELTVEQETIQKTKYSTVTVELIEATNLKPMDSNGLSDPYIKFRLGKKEQKSSCKSKTLSPNWTKEKFQFRLDSDQSHDLKITIWDNDLFTVDDLMGRCQVDLSELEHEKKHKLCLEIKEGLGQIHVNIKISGNSQDRVEDLPSIDIDDTQENEDNRKIEEKYALARTFEDIKDVGELQVKIFCAQGLAAKDNGGTSDPYCVLELDNSHRQTDVIFKNLAPSWDKMFTFKVKDIHSRLEVTVLDDDGNRKSDFLGKIVIPLLNIRNGEKKWFVLKNKSLRRQAQGKVPEILLECSIHWNLGRATVRSIAPREDKFKNENKRFELKQLNKNIAKIKPYQNPALNLLKQTLSIWKFEKPSYSIMAWLLFELTVYFFELYMLPLALVLLFLINARMPFTTDPYIIEDNVEPTQEEANNEDENEKKMSPLAKLSEINKSIKFDELSFMIQEFCGNISSGIEKCNNTLHFCVPFLSWLLVCLLMIVTIVLYLIPVRYLIMMIGAITFIGRLVKYLRNIDSQKKAIKAILAFISCIPDNEDLLDAKQLSGGSIVKVNSVDDCSMHLKEEQEEDCRRKSWNGTDHPTTVLRSCSDKT